MSLDSNLERESTASIFFHCPCPCPVVCYCLGYYSIAGYHHDDTTSTFMEFHNFFSGRREPPLTAFRFRERFFDVRSRVLKTSTSSTAHSVNRG